MENKLKAARMAAGLTQQQLAEKSGVNERQIRRIESGSSSMKNVSLENGLALAKALGTTPENLI